MARVDEELQRLRNQLRTYSRGQAVPATVQENVTISYPDAILYLDGTDDTKPTTDADPVFNITAAEDVRIGSRLTNRSNKYEEIKDYVGTLDS
jgi:hypothetical protein